MCLRSPAQRSLVPVAIRIHTLLENWGLWVGSGKRISGIAWNESKVMIRKPVSHSAARMGAGVPTEVGSR